MREDRFRVTTEDVERAGTADDPLVWYAVQTAPNYEERVCRGLFEQGLVAYLPRETKWHRPTRRGKAEAVRYPKSRPLIKGYLFVGFCSTQRARFDLVRDVYGVWRIVGIGDEPFAIRDQWVQKLADKEARGFFDETRPTQGKHKAGDRVTIIEGPFAQCMGEVIDAIEDGKLRVEVAGLFGVGVPVELDDDHVEALKAA